MLFSKSTLLVGLKCSKHEQVPEPWRPSSPACGFSQRPLDARKGSSTKFSTARVIAGPARPAAALDAALAATAAQDVSRDSGLGTAVVGTATGIIVGMGSCGSVLQGWLATTVTRLFGWTGLFHVLALLTLASACALVPHASDQSHAAFLRRRGEPAPEMEGLVTIDPISGADVGVFTTLSSAKQAPRSRAWWFGVSALAGGAIFLSWLSQA